MAITVQDAARLRAAHHRVELALDAVPLTTLATAQLNQSSFSYPLAQLTVDNTSANWLSADLVNRAYSIGTTAGGSDVMWGAVRKAPTSTLFYPNAFSAGDTGYALDIRQGVANDYHLTVYSHRPLWSHYSRISNKLFYKFHDTAYTDQGSSPAPVCNIGAHRFVYVESGAAAVLAFDTLTSYAWGSKTLTGYAWAVETISGGTASFTTVTNAVSASISFPAGVYIVSCTLTDSGSKTHTAYRYVFVRERSGVNAPFGAAHTWQITSDTQDGTGRRVGLTLYGDFAPTDIYPGQLFILSETATYDDEPLDLDDMRVSTFVGYVAEYTTGRTRSTPSVDITLENPLYFVRKLGAASQYLQEKASPANWTECTSALSHPPGALWYILQHHAPTVLAAHDYLFDADIKDLRRRVFEFPASSIGGQVEKLADYGLGAIGNRSDGTLVFRSHPAYMTNAARNDLDNKFTWNEGDIIPPLTIPYSYTLPVGAVKGYAFSYGGGAQAKPYASRAPGAVAAQGTSQPEFTFTVTTAEGQTRVNEVTGHRFAYEAGKTKPFALTADRNLDIAEPCDVDVWHTLNIPAAYDPKGDGLLNIRALPTRVTRSWRQSELGTPLKSVTVEWQRETFGQPGITVPVETGGANNWVSAGVLQSVVVYDPAIEDSFAVGWNTSGALVRSTNFNTQTPHYEDITSGITGTVCDFTPDYGSEFFTGGVGALGAWVVSVAGTTLAIWYAPDIRTVVPVWTQQTTYTMADSTVSNSARIASSKTSTEFVVTAWRSQSGTRVGRSTDGGTTWGSAVTVGDTASDTANDNADIGLAVDGVNQLVTARHTDGDYYLYLATTTGGSFSRVTTSPASAAPYPLIAVDGQGNCYVRTTVAEAPVADWVVTFGDEAGDADYSYWAGSSYYGTTQSGYGNPGYCARLTGNPITLPRTIWEIRVIVDFGAYYDVDSSWEVQFDWYVAWTGSPNSTARIIPKPATAGAWTDYYLQSRPDLNGAWQHATFSLPAANNPNQIVVLEVQAYGSLTNVDLRVDNIQIYAP